MEIVVIGGGGHASVLIDMLLGQEQWQLLGYLDNEDNGPILGVPYLGSDDRATDLLGRHTHLAAALGIGQVKLGVRRKEIYQYYSEMGFQFPPLVASSAIVGRDVALEDACVIFPGAIVNTRSRVGEGAILNTRVSVDHDCTIGEFTHICPGAVLCGNVMVGPNSIVGAGSVVIQGKTISEGVFVGAGSVVVKDLEVRGMYHGNPARLVL